MQSSKRVIWIIDDRFLGPQLTYYLLKAGYEVGYSHSLKSAIDAINGGEIIELGIPPEISEIENGFASALFGETLFKSDTAERERLRLRDEVMQRSGGLVLSEVSLLIFHTGTDSLRENEKQGLGIEKIVRWNHIGADGVLEEVHKRIGDIPSVAYSAGLFGWNYTNRVKEWGFDALWDVSSIVNALNRGEIGDEELSRCVSETLKAASRRVFLEASVSYNGELEFTYPFDEGRIRGEFG